MLLATPVRIRSPRPWAVMALVVGCLWWAVSVGSAQSPSGTPHPVPTTPPGAVATRPPGIWVDPPPPPAGCVAESEPNDRPDGATTLPADFCVSGELVSEKDQELYLYEVAPEDGLVTWDVTVRGVPGAYTSVHVLPLLSAAGDVPLELSPAGEVARIDSDVWIGVPPGTGQVQLAPGGYLLGISRALPGYQQDLTDDRAWWVEWRRGGSLAPAGDREPNDSATDAAPVAGAFATSGDLAGSPDVYRWTLGADEVDLPWRLAVRSSLGQRLTLELSTADGTTIGYAQAALDGRVTFHDLGLAAGDYLIELPASLGPQPYELWAEPVTETDIDLEPDDAPGQAHVIDPSTRTATGRLTSPADVDQYLVDVDATLATGLVDVELTWSDGLVRTLCVATETRVRLDCGDGVGEVAFRGLLIPEGRYLLTVSGAGGLEDRYRLRVDASGATTPEREVEPNDDVATATRVAAGFTVAGDLIGGPDTFAWTIDEAASQGLWHLDASGTPGLGAAIQLTAADGTAVAQGTLGYDGTSRIWDLRLPVGTYVITLSTNALDPPAYVLRSTSEAATGIDPEPDDQPAQAIQLDPATLSAVGRIPVRTDTDRYRFELGAAAAGSLVEAELAWDGTATRQLCLGTEFGSPIQCASNRSGVTLTNLQLAPGTYQLVVTGDADAASRYQVRVTTGDAPTPDRESEPNDREDLTDAWDSDLVMHGISRDGDIDMYTVHVGEGTPLIWRLDIAGEGVQAPEWRQPDRTHVGSVAVGEDGTSATIEDLYLVSGDHLLTVRGGGDYTLTLTPIGTPDLAAEREPNDDADHAAPLVVGAHRTGRLPAGGDVDVYRFSLAAPEHVLVTVEPTTGGGGGLDLSGASVDLEVTSATTSLVTIAGSDRGGPTVFDGLLPQSDYEVSIRPRAPVGGGPGAADLGYTIRLERADPFVDPTGSPAPALPAELSLSLGVSEVAAYLADGQHVEGVLHIAPIGPTPLDLGLDATTSHHSWAVELPDMVSVPAAGLDVPVVVHVGADAWRGVPVRVTVRARAADGAQATASVDLTPRQDAPPVAPSLVWPIPDGLVGGLDAASLALGGHSPAGDWRADLTHDGIVVAGAGLSRHFSNAPVTLDVDLAGDDPVPVAGTIIDPLAGPGTFGGRPRQFELSLSLDGETYVPAVSGELGPQTLEQSFVLPEPVPARFARLRVDSTWGGTSGPVDIGEWKVVAVPGWAPSTEPIDLASAVRGGHVVWTDPALQAGATEMLGDADTSVRTLYLDPAVPLRVVIGFADDRAAQLTGLRWVDPPGVDPATLVPSVEAFASIGSPIGPWRSIGTWPLERAADGSVAAFALAEPTWARFLRLDLTPNPVVNALTTLPARIGALERPTDDVYRSILGQWGQASPRGIHEVLVPPVVEATAVDVDAPDTADAAQSLAEGQAAPGRVARNVDVDWYEVTVPADRNTLSVDVATERSGDVRIRLLDPTGAEVPATLTPVDAGTRLTAIVEPETSYRVELSQPILSVMFTFDTSSSIGPWIPLVRAAIASFAADVRPGLEAVQVFPYEEPDLLEGWSDQAYLIASAIDAWTTEGGSSFLMASIKRAATALMEREGARAVLVVGDAVGGGWLDGIAVDALERARPGIFPVHVGGVDDPVVSTHVMQDLALANGGFYQYATSLGDMERAFDRMATWLRRPADYVMTYATSLVGYPPGSIEVLPAEGAKVRIGGVAVELVLDTSGSMRARLGSSTRIAVAKRSLQQLVEGSLPDGLPVALRTFKAGRRSCATTLTVKLGPLDGAAMVKRIQRLKVDKGTKTPLAAAIDAVAGDIGDATGPRVVVVVTDGAETCKGDPEAAIRSLVEAGFDTTVNIVGFALDDEVLKARMASWAEAGGGVFFDAQDQTGLSAAIGAILRAPFRVYDEEGALVGEGVVGDTPVTLPMGTYRVEVLADPEVITFEDVRVGTGEAVRLEVGGNQR